MEVNEIFKSFEEKKGLIGVVIIIMLGTLIVLTIQNFDKQNQIIEQGGFIDGKIKCVCTQEAYDACISQYDTGNVLNSSLDNKTYGQIND